MSDRNGHRMDTRAVDRVNRKSQHAVAASTNGLQNRQPTARAPRPLKPARVGGDRVFEYRPRDTAELARIVAGGDLVYAPPAMIEPGAHAGAAVPRPPNLDALRASLRRRHLELVACGPMYWCVTRVPRTRGGTP